jgi:hypothetical protein
MVEIDPWLKSDIFDLNARIIWYNLPREPYSILAPPRCLAQKLFHVIAPPHSGKPRSRDDGIADVMDTPNRHMVAGSARPALHRWIIAVSGLMAFGFVLFLLNILTGRASEKFSQYISPLTALLPYPIILIAMLIGRQRHWVYYICSAMLSLLSVRIIYFTILAYIELMESVPQVRKYYHVSEIDKPFYSNEQASLLFQLGRLLAVGVTIFVTVSYIKNNKSRKYYGLLIKE